MRRFFKTGMNSETGKSLLQEKEKKGNNFKNHLKMKAQVDILFIKDFDYILFSTEDRAEKPPKDCDEISRGEYRMLCKKAKGELPMNEPPEYDKIIFDMNDPVNSLYEALQDKLDNGKLRALMEKIEMSLTKGV